MSLTSRHPRDRASLIAGMVLLTLCGAFIAVHWRVTTSITHFLLSPQEVELGRVMRALTDSELSRTMVFDVQGPDPSLAIAAAGELAMRLEDHPEVDWIRAGVDPETEEAIYRLYYPRRFLFASDDPEHELMLRLADDGLEEAARDLRRQLSSPLAPVIKRIAPADPWLFFRERLAALDGARTGALDLVDDRFVAAVDHRHAIVFLATVHSPFDGGHQRPFEEAIGSAWEQVEKQYPGTTLERSAVHRLAVQSERAIRDDVQRISLFSIVGMVALFVLMYRSLRLLAVAFVPLAAGVLAAMTVGLLVFDELHGLTLAFGSTLIGVCIDYPIHYFTHYVAERGTNGPREALGRVWPAIALGAATTIVGFIGLSWASFPGIREIGVFSSVGVAAALAATRWLLPPLVGARPERAVLLRCAAVWLAARLADLRQGRKVLVFLPLASLVVCAWGFSTVRWVDDASVLNRLEPAAIDEDERVRARVARVDVGRLVVATGVDLEEALARNDLVHTRLADGGLATARSLHAFLWSADLQRRNYEKFRTPGLFERTMAALERNGFRRESFGELADGLSSEPTLLTWDELIDSPLGALVRGFRLDLGDQVALLTFITDVRDPEALKRRLADIPGVHYFDQRSFMATQYKAYRERLEQLVLFGLVAVVVLLAVRYHRGSVVVAAFVPAVLAAGTTIAILALSGQELHLLHLVGILLVLSMGVDYGVFLAEGNRSETVPVTMVGVAMACSSTVLAFGLLSLSSNPALRAVGSTTAIGVLLSLVLAPTTLLLVGSKEPRR